MRRHGAGWRSSRPWPASVPGSACPCSRPRPRSARRDRRDVGSFHLDSRFGHARERLFPRHGREKRAERVAADGLVASVEDGRGARTPRTRGVRLVGDRAENLASVRFGIALLGLADGEIEGAAACGFIDESGRSALPAVVAGEKRANRPVGLFRAREIPSDRGHAPACGRVTVYAPVYAPVSPFGNRIANSRRGRPA